MRESGDAISYLLRSGISQRIRYSILRYSRVRPLLPLDSSRRFGRDVVDDAIDAADFVQDAANHPLEDFVGSGTPVGGHTVFRMPGRDGAGVPYVRWSPTGMPNSSWCVPPSRGESVLVPQVCGATPLQHYGMRMAFSSV